MRIENLVFILGSAFTVSVSLGLASLSIAEAPLYERSRRIFSGVFAIGFGVAALMILVSG